MEYAWTDALASTGLWSCSCMIWETSGPAYGDSCLLTASPSAPWQQRVVLRGSFSLPAGGYQS